VNKNPSKQIFSPEAGEVKRGYPPPVFAGTKRSFNIDKCRLARRLECVTRGGGPDEYLKHLSPVAWEHISLTGEYVWNLQQKTSLDALRPLQLR
jgi:hypothetical protein